MRTFRFVILLLLGTIIHTTAGSISGVVRLVGPAPEIPPSAAEDCGDRSQIVPPLLLGTNQVVANVIVYLGVTAGPSAATNRPAVLNTLHCQIEPRIQIMASGAPLILRNSDPTLHVLQIDLLNLTNPPTRLLKAALPYAGYEKHFNLEQYREPKILRVGDGNDEDGPVAYLAVIPQTWAALTDGQGRFVINGIPPGKHKLVLWHEVLGTVTRDVLVTGELPVDLKIELNAPVAP